jgi:hypothetical protein
MPEIDLETFVHELIAKNELRHQQSIESPVIAAANGLSYGGQTMADKGKKNGSCNRSACQLPLAGKPQFWMDNYQGGRNYYCGKCEALFSEHDRAMRKPLRCTADEDNA